MPEATVKPIKRIMDAVVAGEQRCGLSDAEPRGFGASVEPSGANSFILRYRAGGRGWAKRLIPLGRSGVVTPEAARRSIRDQLGMVARGSDPALEKAVATIADVAERSLAEPVYPKRKPPPARVRDTR